MAGASLFLDDPGSPFPITPLPLGGVRVPRTLFAKMVTDLTAKIALIILWRLPVQGSLEAPKTIL
jgi:hypothetical protein